jgi:hypothetical protein
MVTPAAWRKSSIVAAAQPLARITFGAAFRSMVFVLRSGCHDALHTA